MREITQPDGPALGRCAVCHRLTWDRAEIGHPCDRVRNRDGDRCPGDMLPLGAAGGRD